MSNATAERKHLDELVKKLDDLKASNREAEEQLRGQVNAAYAAWCRSEWMIGAGDVVITERGDEALVESVYYGGYWRDSPWLLVKKKTKGGWAKNVTTAYNWRRP